MQAISIPNRLLTPEIIRGLIQQVREAIVGEDISREDLLDLTDLLGELRVELSKLGH